MDSSISLRPARPTTEEGRLFARFMDEASDGLMRAMFGGGFERIIAKAYLSPGHDMSHETAAFAEREGEIVAMLSSYSSDYHEASSDQPLARAAGLAGIRALPFAVLAHRLFEFMGTLADGDYYVAGLAVSEGQRGQGIGSMLLDHAETKAIEAGCNRLTLDVDVENEHARRLYESRGMTVEAESPAIKLMPNQRVYRMTKPL